MNEHYFIAIEGVIGIGKTTLVRRLQSYFEAEILLEVFEENPFLPRFYEDRERYAFQTQLFFLLSRYQQQNQVVPKALERGTLLSDYTFAKDELFAWLNLKDDELTMYGRVHAALSEKMIKPDLVVYLDAEHDVLMRRIALRDRPYERNMDPNYIRELGRAYEAWLSTLETTPVLRINTTHLDFLARNEDLEHIVALIKASLSRLGTEPRRREVGATVTLPPVGQSSLAAYQAFHHDLDDMKRFSRDLRLNYIGLSEEIGELAQEVKLMMIAQEKEVAGGKGAEVAWENIVYERQARLGEELADVLAYVLKLANSAHIDLEQVYRNKMRVNLEREWHHE
ncbi:MAG TPA: deoxynucleoside kinase [Anaerolineae bacterium]|nr:deoxynucleoside kinase [Anaerolineae bacterium]